MRKLILLVLLAALVAVAVAGCLRNDLGNLHNF
jgi:predicted small secreted protein